MANQEGVKIVITAEDRFTENIKKIEASTKIFGETAKNTERHLAALEKEMIRLVANGMDPASAKIKEMKGNYDKLNQSINSGGGNLKEANKAWSSLSLVIQDLPYGFRGIQNNLPALVGSLAAATGPIYLAFSALIAITTAYEKEIVQLVYGINDAAIANKRMNEAISENIGQAKSQIATDQSLLKIITDTTKSTDERKRALTQLKEEYKGNIELQKLDITDGAKLYDVYNKISDALLRKARATAYATLIAEEEAKIFKLQSQQGEEVVKNLGFMSTSLNILKGGMNGFGASSNVVTAAFSNQAKQISQSQSNIAIFTKKLNENTEAQIKNADAASLDTTGPKKDKTLEERIKRIKEANKAETDAYIQSLDERGQKEYKAGLDLANNLEKMRLAGYTDSTTYYTAYRAEMSNIAKYYDNKQLEEQKKQNEKELKESISFAKHQADIIKTQSDVEQKLFNGNLRQQQDALKANMAKLAVLAANTFDPQVAQVYLDMFDKLNAKLTGLGENWDKTARQINSVIQNFIVSSFSLLGESLGKALAGEDVDILNSFAILIADALINVGKSLIEYATMVGLAMTLFSNPLTWPAALAAGIAAVAAGAFLKSQLSKKNNGGDTPKFANGGIVSGPTLGLMGEYPGARSNPEVIAPLDKLKGLIGGGGGGTLTARISGNDLLILMNKASRTNSTTF